MAVERLRFGRAQTRASIYLEEESAQSPLRRHETVSESAGLFAVARIDQLVQLDQRAIDVYGSLEKLKEEKESRSTKKEVQTEKRFEKKIKQLRQEVPRHPLLFQVPYILSRLFSDASVVFEMRDSTLSSTRASIWNRAVERGDG